MKNTCFHQRCDGYVLVPAIGMALSALFAGPLPAVAVDFGNTVILGDSITQGALNGNHQSFRYELWKQLVDGGDTFDFVGSHSNNYSHSNATDTTSTSTYPDYLGQSFDTDHEGHWGWRASDVLGTTSPTFGISSGTGDMDDWLSSYTADTALVLIGVNDIKFSVNTSVPVTKSRIEAIIANLQSDNPAVDVYLASVLPSATWFASQAKIQALNTQYQDIATLDPGVTYVDLWTGFDVANLYDGIHPNLVGEQLVASRFYSALKAVPEPTSLVLLAIGYFGTLSRRQTTLRK